MVINVLGKVKIGQIIVIDSGKGVALGLFSKYS